MADTPDDLEKLLAEVRKTISDNKKFLENLVEETVEDDDEEDAEPAADDEEFEEL